MYDFLIFHIPVPWGSLSFGGTLVLLSYVTAELYCTLCRSFYVVSLLNFKTLTFGLFSYSNILFREFALISMWRVPAVPIGAHTLLSFLAEPLKQLSENPDTLEDYNTSDNLSEFQDWVCFILTHLFV